MDLKIEATEKTPRIEYNSATGELLMEGICIPEQTHDFFKPVLNFIDTLETSPPKHFILTANLHFFNTGSARYILEVMKNARKLKEKGVDVKFKWRYNEEDEDIEEAGRSYSFILNEPFEMIPFKS
jgi:hypothetical protein